MIFQQYDRDSIEAAMDRWCDFLVVNQDSSQEEATHAGYVFSEFCGLQPEVLEHLVVRLCQAPGVGQWRAAATLTGVLLGLLIAQQGDEPADS